MTLTFASQRRFVLKRKDQYYFLIAMVLLGGCAQKTMEVDKLAPETVVKRPSIALIPLTPALTQEPESKPLPDFAAMKMRNRKNAFITFLRPIIRAENMMVKAQRTRLLALPSSVRTSTEDRLWLNELAREYGLKPTSRAVTLRKALIKRVDVVPEWLPLMQAANESAWGTSRFARQGNNLFGLWCFTKGCGIVPNRRIQGASHEVAAFKSPTESVHAYLHSLNSAKAYRYFRNIRAGLRRQGKPLSAEVLAAGLERYSGRGRAYVMDIRRMIDTNRSNFEE